MSVILGRGGILGVLAQFLVEQECKVLIGGVQEGSLAKEDASETPKEQDCAPQTNVQVLKAHHRVFSNVQISAHFSESKNV